MPEVLRMPEVAANTVEAVVAGWNVEPGARYAAGEPIVTVETEKAVVDVEAEADGVLLRLLAEPGATIRVGEPIAIWGTGDEGSADVDAFLATLGVGPAAEAALPAAVPPAGPSAGSSAGPAALAAPAAPVEAAAEPVADGRVPGQRRFSSPLARRIAGEHGIDIADVVGTGPGGRIRRRDVEAAVAARATPTPTPTPTPAAAPVTPAVPAVPAVPVVPAAASAGYEDVPNSRIRQATARRLVESTQTAPHFYLRGTARVDRLLALRAELNAAGGDVRISVNDLVVKAVALAHLAVPAMNVQWLGEAIRHFRGVDVAVAVATDAGLVTPVVRGVDALTLSGLSAATRDLAGRARERRLQQSELEGGSITVTNLGMYGTEEFAAIINPPQAAILAVGAARQVAVVEDGAPAVGTVMTLTLSVDHRPVDGAVAAEWMRALLGLLENPLRILL